MTADLAAEIEVRALTGPALEAALDGVAALRIAIFRDWPYLYDGNLDYERAYLQTYRDNPGALLVGAFHEEDHAEAFSAPFRALNIPLTEILYGAESVLLPAYRGIGLGHRFIDLREDHARAMHRDYVAFCSVKRPESHPMKPENARSNDAFWMGRGYEPLPGVLAEFAWKDLGDSAETTKHLQFWMRKL